MGGMAINSRVSWTYFCLPLMSYEGKFCFKSNFSTMELNGFMLIKLMVVPLGHTNVLMVHLTLGKLWRNYTMNCWVQLQSTFFGLHPFQAWACERLP